jgi:16S rRNA (cytosine967-C5)-methyltransferase
MRLHRNLVFTVIDSLNSIFNEEVYAHKAVEAALKKDPRWGARDRKFVAETIYEIVRWKRLYNEIAETKDHYSRENLWKLFTVWAVLRGIELPDWKYFANAPVRRIKGRFDEVQSIRKIKESIPDWLDEMGVAELGENWDKEIKALNLQAAVVLRANTLRGTRTNLEKNLNENEVETIVDPKYKDALILKERKNVFITDAFKSGLFEVQDASSQLVAEFLDVKPGMRVIDTCAGAGGKTLHLAALMENKGSIIAMDIYAGKLKELSRRAKRAGAHNITPKPIESSKTIKKLYNSADRVLIDAPCSGLGVLKRNPDAKWKLQPEFIDNIRKTQQEIIQSYSKLVKKGGKLVYATCSIFPSENENQVATFLESNDEYILIRDKTVLPSESGFDGFYMALLERKA